MNKSKEDEITSFNNKIQATFNTSITHTWIPTNFGKRCLFLKVHNQDILIGEKEDFELELYLALKEELHKSKFFDMVALM